MLRHNRADPARHFLRRPLIITPTARFHRILKKFKSFAAFLPMATLVSARAAQGRPLRGPWVEGGNMQHRAYIWPCAPVAAHRLGLALGVLLLAACKTARPAPVSEAAAQVDDLDPPLRDQPRLLLPERQSNAEGGRAFIKRIQRLSLIEREGQIWDAILAGNVPEALRTLVAVPLRELDAKGHTRRALVWVMPDYLAVGSDADYVRVPLSLDLASRLAVELGMSLPTPRLVDSIYRAAHLRLPPRPMPVKEGMTSLAYAAQHNEIVEQQLRPLLGASSRVGLLLAGHKKDVVMSKELLSRRGRVAIFGWHGGKGGRPIQRLSTVHARWYSDYSHGIRLVSNIMELEGRPLALSAALGDQLLAPLLSHEGPFATFAGLQEALAGAPLSEPTRRRQAPSQRHPSHWASED